MSTLLARLAAPLPSPAAPMRALPLFLLVGCGDISNAFLLEDAEYLDALPSQERHTVSIEPTATSDGAEGWRDHAPELLLLTAQVSDTVNGTLLDVLEAIDHVRTLRPTQRLPDGRRWGPWAWQDGVDLEVRMDRTGAGRFDWGVDASSSATTVPYMAGTHYAGDTVAAGDGAFTWSFDELAIVAGGPARGTLAVDYDNRAGIDLLVDIDGVTAGVEPPLTARYAFRLVEGEGDFQYTFSGDTDGDGLAEDYSIRTRWIEGVGGRSDAIVTGGSLGPYVERWSQCWNGAVDLVYEVDSLGLRIPVGEESACVYAEFGEVDRL